MRVAAILLSCVALLAGCKPTPPATLPELAAEVLDQPSWLAEDRECPADSMARAEVEALPEGRYCDLDDSGSCMERCSDGDGASCYWLANRLEKTDADRSAVTALYTRSCRLGVASGCTNRASYLLKHPTEKGDAACTLLTFERSCGFDDPWACTMFAFQLTRDGNAGDEDRRRALDALAKSCRDGEDSPACIAGKEVEQSLQK